MRLRAAVLLPARASWRARGTTNKHAGTDKLLRHPPMLLSKVCWLEELTNHQLDESFPGRTAHVSNYFQLRVSGCC